MLNPKDTFTTLQQQKVLVTGGAGFIGSHLVDQLLANHNQVICLDNFSTGKLDNLKEAQQHPNFTLVDGDIRNYDKCLLACEGVSYVFHQAALGSVPRSINDPISTNEVNVGGFVNVITAAKEVNVKRFIYAASSSTYGNHPGLPKIEEVIGQPLSPYAVSKYVNELYAKVFGQVYGMETIGLRYFNVFGERQDPGGAYAAVIPRFVKTLINRESPIIFGDGSHSRDFTYIDNVIQANLLAAVTQNPAAINQIFNVAYGEATSLNQLATSIIELLAKYIPEVKNIPLTYGPERAGDVKHSLADITKAKSYLGYAPKYNVARGLSKSIDWYFNNYNLQN